MLVHRFEEYIINSLQHDKDKRRRNVTNDQTFINTYLSDKLLQGRGNGTFQTPDGQKITWISSDIGRSVDGRWVFYGIMLFNNTQSKSLSFLNNSVGLSRDILGNETDRIWLLK